MMPPMLEKIMMASEVATASCIWKRSAMTMMGIITMAPPKPNMPESTPMGTAQAAQTHGLLTMPTSSTLGARDSSMRMALTSTMMP